MKYLALAGVLLLAACASPSADGLPELDAITTEDAERALQIAEESGDVLGARCAAYWVEHAGEPIGTPDPVGPLSAYMKARAVRIRIDDGISDELRMACGPALMESRSVIRRLLFRAIVP